jgi:NADPH-dependent ferric siderophore reductase
VSAWAASAAAGDLAAISGPGRGYPIDPDATGFLVVGDETAIPAIRQLLTSLPTDRPVHVTIEVVDDAARQDLPAHPTASVTWTTQPPAALPGHTLVDAVAGAAIPTGTRVWAAGEAAAMQRIRRHLFEVREVPRPQTWVRGYWKVGSAGDGDDA